MGVEGMGTVKSVEYKGSSLNGNKKYRIVMKE